MNIIKSLLLVGSIVIALFAILVSVAKNAEPVNMSVWEVEFVRPDGNVHRTIRVKSDSAPLGQPLAGGHTSLLLDSGNCNYTKADVVIPSGWMFQAKRLESAK